MLRHYHKTWKDNQMIQLAEEAMKGGYNKILIDLARPTYTTCAQTTGLPADEFDECVLDDNASAVDSVAPPPVLTIFPAPPAVAPQQVSYVESQAGAAKRWRRRCFYYPLCGKPADDCGGWHDGTCSRVNTKKIVKPSQEQLKSAKEEKRREAKRLLAQEKREKKNEYPGVVYRNNSIKQSVTYSGYLGNLSNLYQE
jgi:hypothetical protein